MKKNKLAQKKKPVTVESDFFELMWEKSWTYIKTVVDVAREPMVILDKDLCVMAANEAFYDTYEVKKKGTEGQKLFELGNGQWDIPILKKLLEKVAIEHTFFKGFQVAHNFPTIGRRVMILNARRIQVADDTTTDSFPPLILLAMEDVTDMMVVAESLSNHANAIEAKMALKTQRLEVHIEELERQMKIVKKNK